MFSPSMNQAMGSHAPQIYAPQIERQHKVLPRGNPSSKTTNLVVLGNEDIGVATLPATIAISHGAVRRQPAGRCAPGASQKPP